MKKTLTMLFLLCICLAANAGKKDRGVASIGNDAPTYLEPGQWMVGGSIAWSTHGSSNYNFLLINNINSKGYQLQINPTVVYTLKKNLAVGAAFTYKRGYLDLATAGIAVKDVSINVEDYYSLSHKYGTRLFVRPYLPIGHSGRVAFYVDCGLELEGGQSKLSNKQNGQIVGTYQTTFSTALVAYPGISAFITRHFAMEASVGIFGVGVSCVNQTHNQIYEGTAITPKGYLSVNLLAISIGMYYSF